MVCGNFRAQNIKSVVVCGIQADPSGCVFKFKLRKEICGCDIRKYSFCYRVVNVWNSLPDYVVEADSFNSFKSR